MANNEKIDFQYQKYYSSKKESYFGFIIIISIIIMALVNLITGVILLVVCIIGANIYIWNMNKTKSGTFILNEREFIFDNTTINYDDVTLIAREVYDQSSSVWGISYTTPNPNQYIILLKNSKKLIFQVSSKEEKEFSEKINKLNKKIYKSNFLGVGLANKYKNMSNEEAEDKEKQYQEEFPQSTYSLEKAINFVIKKSNILYEDRTEIN